ncbi:hypothetical protein STEG23_033847, partial [Scotinomys teguina]
PLPLPTPANNNKERKGKVRVTPRHVRVPGCSDGVNSSTSLPDGQRLRSPATLAPVGCDPVNHSGAWDANAIDNHRSFSDKHGLTGKRELQLEVEEGRTGSIDGPLPESNIVRTIMEFLSFLHLKEAGALDSLPGLPLATSSEDLEQS